MTQTIIYIILGTLLLALLALIGMLAFYAIIVLSHEWRWRRDADPQALNGRPKIK